MRRLHFGTLAVAAFSFAAALTLVGCGGTKETASNDNDNTEVKKTPKKVASTKKGVPSGTGTLKGKVTFTGPKPDIAALNAALLEQMNKKADDKQHCLAEASPAEKEEQEWVISDSGGLANVFVYLKPAEGTFFELTADSPGVKAAKGKEVVLDQPHCAFIPHAIAYFPSYTDPKTKKSVPTGEKFVVKNSAEMSHNTKYGDNNRDQAGDNLTIPKGGSLPVTNLIPSDNEVVIQCGIHPWMSATARVFNHPYFAITDKDGNFEIKNVPNGDVNVVAWHEAAKYLSTGGAKGQKITLSDKDTTQDFTAKTK